MRRYLFFINQLYSYSILRPLQEAIWKRGDEVAWFLHGVEDRLRNNEIRLHTVEEVQQYNPLAVFVPGNWVPDFFPGIKVEVFHGLANDQTGKKGHFRIRGLFDMYCTHAPAVTHQFEQLAEQHGTFVVRETGWPKLDPLFNENLCRDDQKNDLLNNLQKNKPVVLYASTFSPSLTSAPYLIDTISELSRSGKWQWLITLHPKTPVDILNQYKAMAGEHCIFIESSFSVLPLLKTADVMLCDTSSIALEFMMLNKPVATFRTKVPGPHVIDVTETDQLESAIEKALSRPDELLKSMNDYINALHSFRDGKSSQRILMAVDEFIEQGLAEKLKSKPLNLWRKIQMRKRMGYFKI